MPINVNLIITEIALRLSMLIKFNTKSASWTSEVQSYSSQIFPPCLLIYHINNPIVKVTEGSRRKKILCVVFM